MTRDGVAPAGGALPPGLERYARQIQFPEFGIEGQEALLRARVVLVGVGALGSHIADSLVRAGVGHLVLADRDFIELNNLQRQALYDEEDIAQNLPKAEAAARKLRRINSTVTIEPRVMDVNYENVEELIAGADLVLDGTDNFEARYLINDACVKHGLPWVYGGVLASYGSGMQSCGTVKLTKDLQLPIRGKDVVIVEDIIDTGITLRHLYRRLKARRPRTLKVAALLDKPERRAVTFQADYVGFEIPDHFVVGYGLDCGEEYRNLRGIYAIQK